MQLIKLRLVVVTCGGGGDEVAHALGGHVAADEPKRLQPRDRPPDAPVGYAKPPREVLVGRIAAPVSAVEAEHHRVYELVGRREPPVAKYAVPQHYVFLLLFSRALHPPPVHTMFHHLPHLQSIFVPHRVLRPHRVPRPPTPRVFT